MRGESSQSCRGCVGAAGATSEWLLTSSNGLGQHPGSLTLQSVNNIYVPAPAELEKPCQGWSRPAWFPPRLSWRPPKWTLSALVKLNSLSPSHAGLPLWTAKPQHLTTARTRVTGREV